MKTGTTAVQTFLNVNQDILQANGIRFVWLRRSMLEELAAVLRDSSNYCSVLVASHECLCRRGQTELSDVVSGFEGEIHAWLTARPLRELYPSLYLQNLKGRSMRTSTYEDFIQEQEQRDREPDLVNKGQIFNFSYLDCHVAGAGPRVHWIRYSRTNLLRDVVSLLAGLASIPLSFDSFRPLPVPSGNNPRRSLHFAVADEARRLNFRCEAGELSPQKRQQELIKLLGQSEHIRSNRLLSEPERSLYRSRLDQLDLEINGAFWRQYFSDDRSNC